MNWSSVTNDKGTIVITVYEADLIVRKHHFSKMRNSSVNVKVTFDKVYQHDIEQSLQVIADEAFGKLWEKVTVVMTVRQDNARQVVDNWNMTNNNINRTLIVDEYQGVLSQVMFSPINC